MESKVLTKAEAVELYGSDECKAHFANYNKFKSKKVENALIKTLNQHFESVEAGVKNTNESGKGYRVTGERKELAIREDKRVNNGAWSIDYTKNMDVIILSALRQKSISKVAQTMRKWLLDFTLIDKSLFDLMASRDNYKVKLNHRDMLISDGVIKKGEDLIIKDYLYLNRELMGQLESSLNRLKKANIINFYEVIKAETTDGMIINLDEVTVFNINEKRIEIMKEYNTDSWEWENLTNKPDVIRSKADYADYLAKDIFDMNGKHISISFFWKAMAISPKSGEKRILTYLEKYSPDMIEVFLNDEIKFEKDNQLEYINGRISRTENLAQKQVDRFLSRHPHNHKVMGKRKPVEEFFEQKAEYYALYFDKTFVNRIVEMEKYYSFKIREEL